MFNFASDFFVLINQILNRCIYNPHIKRLLLPYSHRINSILFFKKIFGHSFKFVRESTLKNTREWRKSPECPKQPEKKTLRVQEHVGWLNTMTANNYSCLLESTYLSFDYIVWQIKWQKKSMHAWMRGRGDRQGLKTSLSEKHNSCPAQKMPLSSSTPFSFPSAWAVVRVNTKLPAIIQLQQLCLPQMRSACN